MTRRNLLLCAFITLSTPAHAGEAWEADGGAFVDDELAFVDGEPSPGDFDDGGVAPDEVSTYQSPLDLAEGDAGSSLAANNGNTVGGGGIACSASPFAPASSGAPVVALLGLALGLFRRRA